MNECTYVQTAYETFTLKSGITKYFDEMNLLTFCMPNKFNKINADIQISPANKYNITYKQ